METETKIDNELIARWMGLEINTQYGLEVLMPPDNPGANGYWIAPKYDNSWDWLMPVVEKIDRMNFKTFIDWKGHESKDANICVISERDYTIIVNVSHGSKISAVYQAVLAFIKWYKENGNRNKNIL